MLELPWISGGVEFPPTSLALEDPNGLLAVGGDLSPNRLLSAYRHGIFPWYSDGQPILWWSPAPRTVFFPEQIHCSRSMVKFIRKSRWQVTVDRAFTRVIEACSSARKDGGGTWITAEMKGAYITLHKLGYAHSLEVWDENLLVGGIYGVSLGRMFFGESMFSQRTNGSKFALIMLGRFLNCYGFEILDAQVESSHLLSMGSIELDRAEFEQKLHLNTTSALIDSMQQLWRNALGKPINREGYFET